jgi:SWI/SNF-related matrix-associated actin-dependent regulator of chromatin subfamily A-like protein 1
MTEVFAVCHLRTMLGATGGDLKLRKFQRADINFIKKHNLRVILASAPGTGKTPISVVSILETGKWSLPCLVVCPASVTRHWKREFKKWAPGLRTQIVEDMSCDLDRDANVYITSWALLDPRSTEYLGLGIQSVVADECHMAKNPDALRSQSLAFLTRNAKGILLLSGTPIVNSRDELGVLQELYGTRKPPMIRRLLEDVAPDVPPKKRSYLYVRLRDKHQAEYDRADGDFETWLRKEKEKLLGEGLAEAAVERSMAAEAFTKVGYLRRLAGLCKVPAAADWVSRAVRIGEPVVVFVEHQSVLKKLVKCLRNQRVRHAVIEGKTSPKKRQRYIDQFQANKYPVLICTKAGKEGITLHAARHLLFVERFFTSAEEEQAEDRIRRIGQKHATTIWFLHAAGTIDDRVDTIVRTKRQIIRAAIGAEDTAETAISNVEQLVRSWDQFVSPERKITSLGRGDPLPPLPPPAKTHAVVFSSKRWSTRTAARWCRMHGYLPSSRSDLLGRFKLVVHPVDIFKPNEFKSVRVCQDVKVLVGAKLSPRNEARVRRQLGHNRRS